jgi:hypothetical protein
MAQRKRAVCPLVNQAAVVAFVKRMARLTRNCPQEKEKAVTRAQRIDKG